MSDPVLTAPHNLDAEKAVLGSLFINNGVIPLVATILKPADFYSTPHQHIFRAIVRLNESGVAVDEMTVFDELKRLKKIEETGGRVYLSSLEAQVMASTNVRHHADIVRKHSLLRRIIYSCTETLNACQEQQEDPEELIAGYQQTALELSTDMPVDTVTWVADATQPVLDEIERLHADKRDISGLRTHFVDLDQMLMGFQPSDLIILAARPSMGKTALALNIAKNVALINDPALPVLFFSMEMSANQILHRLLSMLSRVTMHHLRTGAFDKNDWQRLVEQANILGAAPIAIDDTPALTAKELCTRARRVKAETPDLALIVVDYVQLMRGSKNASRENRQREVAEISGELKALARQLNVPVLMLSQFSRKVEDRDKYGFAKPRLSDLRESGALEQDADVVLFIHRYPHKEPPLDESVMTQDGPMPAAAHAWIIVAKQRNGPTGEIQMNFIRQFTAFRTMVRSAWVDEDDIGKARKKKGAGSKDVIKVLTEHGPLSHKDLVEKLVEVVEIGISTAKNRVKEAQRAALIRLNEKAQYELCEKPAEEEP
jgi:replicative DNA helicase